MRGVAICLVAALAAGAGVAGKEDSGSEPLTIPIGPERYVELYKKIFAVHAAKPQTSVADQTNLSQIALRLWRQTQDVKYREAAVRRFEDLLAQPGFLLADFHALQGFGELAWMLKQEQLLKPECLARVRSLAVEQLADFRKSTDTLDHNIRLATVKGYAGLWRFMEGEPFPEREATLQRFETYWAAIRGAGDLDEDASNYDSLGIAFLLDIARIMKREEDLKNSPGFRRMLERVRDLTSPAGLIPEYGDGYFSYQGVLLDRVYILEIAARYFDDPTFLYAARKLLARPQMGVPGMDGAYRAMPLIDTPLKPMEPQQPTGPASRVTYRSRQGAAEAFVDKLILRTGWEPGAAMLMLDLYAQGSHAHREKGPSLAYFEAGQVPLFHNLGRHQTRSAIAGNIAWALPSTERFPGCWNRPNEWFTMTLPVEYLHQQDGRPYIAPALSLRNFQERNTACEYLFFDNLRLTGTKGALLVDGFETREPWDKSVLKTTEVVCSEEHTEGRCSQRVVWKPLPSAHLNRNLLARPAQPFDPADYRALKLDLKYTGARPYMHIRGLGTQVDLGDQLLVFRTGSATVEQRGQDAYGRVAFPLYIQDGVRLTRNFVLTAEGFLVIHDLLEHQGALSGWSAGQLWQLYELQAQGPGWFCGDDDGSYPAVGDPRVSTRTRRMLVRFACDKDTRTGVEEVRQGYHDPNPKGRKAERFFTCFSVRPAIPAGTESFALAVLPHEPAAGEPAAMASRVSVKVLPEGGAAATLEGADGQRVRVSIAAQSWRVEREKVEP